MRITAADIGALTRRAVEDGGLLEFMRQAWSQVEPGEFQENWHHKIMCDALEAVSRGEIRKLVICVPPGSTKTLLTGVFWPAWDWLEHPWRRIIHTTYGGGLSLKAARNMRDLVNSEWYQALTGGRISVPYQNTRAAAFFKNSCKGSRFSGSVGGEVTGNHAHILIGDDLNKTMDARGTPTKLDASWEFWHDDLPTRQADPKTTAKVLIGQRIHVDDVPGRWMREFGDEITVICIPMRGEPDRDTCHPDDTRAEGELMWPGRFDDEELAELDAMSPSVAAAQLQQRPIPPGGQLLRPEYLSNRYDLLPGRLQSHLEGEGRYPGIVVRIYGDMTFKGKATSDYTVYQCWAFYEGEPWLLDQVRGQMGFREAKQALLAFKARWPMATGVKLEDAANAPAMVDDMRREIPGLVLAPMQGGCLARTQQCEGHWANRPHLPAQAPWMGGSDGFVAEHLAYDGLGTRHDDQVATSSLALLDLSSGSAQAYIEAWRRVAANEH